MSANDQVEHSPPSKLRPARRLYFGVPVEVTVPAALVTSYAKDKNGKFTVPFRYVAEGVREVKEVQHGY